jgi:pyruvate formate lyase activating enzyme
LEKGCVFDIKRYAVDDGPGIRTTVFMKGCPLRCWWCHNPESQLPSPELMFKTHRCTGCGECVNACPKKAISREGKGISIDRDRCDNCGDCSEACPADALVMVGKEVSAAEVIKEPLRDRAFYEESGGGITFSGGEPLLQPDFLDAVLGECKDKGFHTCVDTSGYAGQRAVDRISGKVDLFLYDLKVTDDKKHRKYTGVSNRLIIENFGRLADRGRNLLVRFPVVPGINDDEKNLRETAKLMLAHNVKQVCLLPYHRAGIEKYQSLGRAYRMEDVQAPTDNRMRLIRKKMEAYGLEVQIGGG